MALSTEQVKKHLREGKTAIQIAKKYKITRQAVYCHIEKIKRKKKKEKMPEKPKKNYNALIDWKIYNEGLVKRGELLLDFNIFKNWEEEKLMQNEGKVGAPYKYPDSFIIFLLQIKSVFQIDYRMTEGITRKLIAFIPQAEKACDYSTLQKRLKELAIDLKVYSKIKEVQDIAGDSSGLKTTERGEYRMNKYKDGKRKKYVKIHIAVNIKESQVVSCIVTDEGGSDGKQLADLVVEAEKEGKVAKGLFDKGYDSKENFWFLKEKGIICGIKPRETMTGNRLEKEIKKAEKEVEDDENSEETKKRLLRLQEMKKYQKDEDGWKKEKNYGQRWEVEGRFSVFKRLFGESIFSKRMKSTKNEVILKTNLMNRFASFLIEGTKANYD